MAIADWFLLFATAELNCRGPDRCRGLVARTEFQQTAWTDCIGAIVAGANVNGVGKNHEGNGCLGHASFVK